jgi:hypothetical protein
MNKRKLTFGLPLLILSIICLSIALWQYLSEPFSVDQIFGDHKRVQSVEGGMSLFTPPRGTPRIMVTDSQKRIYFIDCLVNTSFCNKSAPGLKVRMNIVNIEHDFYWPIDAKFEPGGFLDRERSIFLYQLYLERSQSLYKFWLALSLAFLIFSIWFRGRSLF